MEEDSGKESKSDGSGDASELSPLRGEDSGISLASKSDDVDSGKSTGASLAASIRKDSQCPEADSAVEVKSESSPSTTDDIEMCSELAEASTDKDNASKAEPESAQSDENHMSLSPAAADCEEENMLIDPEDVVLALDHVVEGCSPPDIQPARVQLETVTSSTSASKSEQTGSKGSDEAQPESSCSQRKEKEGEVSSSTSGHGEEESAEVVAPEDLPDLSTDSDGEDTLDSDDNEEGAGVINASFLTPAQRRIIQRKKRQAKMFSSRGRRLDSSSDSDDDSDTAMTDEDARGGSGRKTQTERESDASNREDDGDDEEVRRVVQAMLDKVMPPQNWSSLRELRKREYGGARRQGANWFREGVLGSLQMVSRLVIVEKMKGHEGCVNALSFNRIGTLLASGSDDLDIILWNWQRGRPSVTYESGHRSNVFQAKFMPFSGDCHVISCARDGQVRLAELNSSGVCRSTRKLAQHRGAAHKLALEHDSPHVFLSSGEDAVAYLFDLRQEKPHRLVTARENEKKVPLYSIHSNPCDSQQFCVGGRDHYIRVYDKRKISEQENGGVLKKYCPHHLETNDLKATVTCACYNYNGSEILGSYNDEDIYLFDNTMSDGADFLHKYSGHRNNATVKGVTFYGPRSEFIVSGSDCGHVFFWDKNTEKIINFQDGDDTGVINVLEPHPSLPVLATSGLDHDVKLWMPMLAEPKVAARLEQTIMTNQVERNLERATSAPEIGGQMLWFIMHHYRNSARRWMREEGQVLSTSEEDDDEDHSDDSESNHMQCAQS